MVNAEIEGLYHALLDAWNRGDAAGFAALFVGDGHCIGFDGSEMHGRAEIESTLAGIFRDHQTASYVALVRAVTAPSPNVAILRAHVGMVPPGQSDVKPDANAVQVVVLVRAGHGWGIELLQNTPAAYHGRPGAAAQLTDELRQHLRSR
jgi:uncharacterized protein (TIGR02246 family)